MGELIDFDSLAHNNGPLWDNATRASDTSWSSLTCAQPPGLALPKTRLLRRRSAWSAAHSERIYLGACRGRTRKASAVKHAALAACTMRCQVRPTTETSK